VTAFTEDRESVGPVVTSPRVAGREGLRFALFWGAPSLIWQSLFFLAPMGFLVAMTFWSVRSFKLTPDFTLANWKFIFGASFFFSAYLYTLKLAVVTAFAASIIAFPSAYALAFAVPAGLRRLFVSMLLVPFFTSYPVRIYSLEIFLSPQGIVNRALAAAGLAPIHLIGTPTATVIGYLTLSLPVVVLLQTLALTGVDPALIEAAHNLRCGRLRTIASVVLPSARTGLIVSAAFAFVLTFGDYIAPLYLGGSKPPTLSILIADQVKSGNNWPRASVVAVTMIVTLAAALTVMLGLAYRNPKGRP